MFSVACLFSSNQRHCGVMFCFVVDLLRIGFIKHSLCCLLVFLLLKGSCPHVVRLPWQHCCEADNCKAKGMESFMCSPQTASHNFECSFFLFVLEKTGLYPINRLNTISATE